MKLKHVLLCFSLFAVFAITFNASAGTKAKSEKMNNSEKAFKILEKARKNRTSTIAIKTKRVNIEGKKVVIKTNTWNKFFPDGTSAMKIEELWKEAKTGNIISKSIDLVMVDGKVWTIIGDIAIRNKEMSFSKNVPDSLPKGKPTYKLSEVVFKGVPCFKVTSITSPETLKDIPLAMVVYFIGKKDYFIRNTTYYSGGGKELISLSYDSIEPMKKVGDDFFKIPANCTIYTPKDTDSYIDFISLAENKLKFTLNPKSKTTIAEKEYYEEKYGTSDIDKILSQYHH